MIALETLRKRAGLDPADDSRDDDLTAAYAQAIAFAEIYLDRRLERLTLTETFNPDQPHIFLSAWPVDSVTSVSSTLGAIDASLYWSNLVSGRLVTRNGGAWSSEPITVDYVGGYVDLPAPLAWAILQIFDQLWMTDPAYGGTVGGSGVGAPIGKISVVGVGSIDYVTSSGSSSAQDGQADPWAMISAEVAAVLLRYANHAIMGVG